MKTIETTEREIHRLMILNEDKAGRVLAFMSKKEANELKKELAELEKIRATLMSGVTEQTLFTLRNRTQQEIDTINAGLKVWMLNTPVERHAHPHIYYFSIMGLPAKKKQLAFLNSILEG